MPTRVVRAGARRESGGAASTVGRGAIVALIVACAVGTMSNAVPASTQVHSPDGVASRSAAKTKKPLTKKQYIAQANALCDAAATAFGPVNQQLQQLRDRSQPTAHITFVLKRSFAPIVQHQISKTEALVPPRRDQTKVSKILGATRSALTKVMATPQLLGAKRSPFLAADTLARAYGLEGAAGSAACTGNGASASLQWTAPQQIDTYQNGLGDVSCPSVTFCVAVGSTGPGVVGSALIWNGTSWSVSAPQLFARGNLNHVSCPSATFCMVGAVDGGALVWNGTSWSAGSQIRWPDPKDGITNLACATASFCLAGDEDGDIRVWNGSAWSIDHQVVPGTTSGGAHAISCPTASFCMAVNVLGNAIIWNGTSLSAPVDIDGSNNLEAVSCPNASFCMALDDKDWLTWNGTSWSISQPIGTVRTGPPADYVGITRVSCPTTHFCVAVLSDGHAIAWNGTSWSTPQQINPNLANARGPATASSNGHPSLGLKSVSCPTTTFCVAVGSDGSAVIGRRVRT
jgi:hypothetical protein